MDELAIEYAGETLLLLADKAIYWPQQHTLLVADLHIGKAASYRALHQPVPRGTTEATLARLDQLLARYACNRLVVLGDFLHARTARAAGTLAALAAWRTRHCELEIVLVRGNHDRHAGDPPVELGITVHEEPWLLGPFALCHEPEPHASHAVLAGHVHPAYVLRGRARQRLRLPCFVIGAQVAVLPAFGEFTGGWNVAPQAGTRMFLTGADRVWPLTQ
ncbi:ligase-associated DNA damage response endonuclease PdeM [Pseudomonas sp. SWRI107]|uniref:ligase-associated DNA damage response endonuclease PdeM n=1 Tax=Pseudomonas TaxID=286 RepID=UPI001645C1C3|nr:MULTISPECIES: ligase-associated DNA damage response endonuclease PdeM [Pseudomonas]MBC3410124.1 ligase-associated DNA damage response endonuclease PdeM [Pseudomonas sp. SWRI51]MBV4533309.1 ligase-associated DNA damage response endonuclease PdeM [Pseudomonas farsensis]